MTQYVFTPPPTYAVPIVGKEELFPVNRLFFVGRNYHAHAAEMGTSVDKANSRPFYFTKSPSTLVQTGATVAYPLSTTNYHFEMELVLAIGASGVNVKADEVEKLVYGYACGLDMTRRDLQAESKKKGLPWDTGKDVEDSSVISPIVPMPNKVLENAHIELSVNGQIKQNSDINLLIWNVREIVADLSTYYHLQPGDLIYTGTPDGVGPVVAGDKITGLVDGVGTIALNFLP